MVKFPKGFFWGTSVAAYQVEGGNDEWSDWGRWTPRAGRACDFWNGYERYLDLARDLGTNAFRFSIEWARVEPQEGVWDEEALARYRDIVLAAKARGLEPFVTLWHFSLPKWIAERGGWRNGKAPFWFEEYAEKIAGVLSEDVRYWLTVNEPSVLLSHGYIIGQWPPGRRGALFAAYQARRHIIEAHRLAYSHLKSLNPAALVSAALNLSADAPARARHPLDRLAVSIVKAGGDFGFIRAIVDSLDFIGLNYYTGHRMKFIADPRMYFIDAINPGTECSDLGWPIYPEGLRILAEELSREFGLPIIVTENGIADARDLSRPQFIASHTAALSRAILAGADVRGYFHWSLMDNFEWAHGFEPRFGLYEMDYSAMTAVPRRESVGLYRAIAQNNGLATDMLRRYVNIPRVIE